MTSAEVDALLTILDGRSYDPIAHRAAALIREQRAAIERRVCDHHGQIWTREEWTQMGGGESGLDVCNELQQRAERAESELALSRAAAKALQDNHNALHDRAERAEDDKDDLLRLHGETIIERDQLKAALQQDAARYRYIKHNPVTFNDGRYIAWLPTELDDVVDAAMEGQQK